MAFITGLWLLTSSGYICSDWFDANEEAILFGAYHHWQEENEGEYPFSYCFFYDEGDGTKSYSCEQGFTREQYDY